MVIPTPVPTPEPTPEPELPPSTNPRLESAEALLMGGDAAGSRAAIQALRPEEIEAFTEDEAATYEDIRSALAGADRDRAIRDLRGGLEKGIKLWNARLAFHLHCRDRGFAAHVQPI